MQTQDEYLVSKSLFYNTLDIRFAHFSYFPKNTYIRMTKCFLSMISLNWVQKHNVNTYEAPLIPFQGFLADKKCASRYYSNSQSHHLGSLLHYYLLIDRYHTYATYKIEDGYMDSVCRHSKGLSVIS